MKSLLPILAMVCTVLATLVSITFCLAGGANSTPMQIRVLKYVMLGVTLLGIAGVTAGIFLMRSGHHGWAAGAAFAPAVIMVLAFIIAMILEL